MHRKSELALDRPSNAPDGIYYMYENVLNKQYSFQDARTVIRNWRALSEDTNIAAGRVLDIFEAATIHDDSIANIEFLANLICEEVLNKVRDAAQVQLGMNIKNGNRKRSLRKIHTVVGAANLPNAYKNPTQEKVKEERKRQGYTGKPYGGLKKIEKDTDEAKTKKDETVEECYNRMLEKAIAIEQCDRILSNNESLNKRFDFDRAIRESDDIQETVYQLCEYIDTYNAPFKVRFNTALENIAYSLHKNGVNIANEELIPMITGYYGMHEFITENKFDDMVYILSEAKLFTPEETAYTLSVIIDDEDEVSKPNSIYEAFDIICEAKKPIDPNKELSKFKLKPNKDAASFKSLLERIYANDSTSIAENMDNIFDILRYGIIVGSFAINPVLAIVTLITDYCLKTKYGRSGLQKSIKKYDKEIMRVNRQIKKCDDDAKKEALKKYRDKLFECRSLMTDKLDKLYTRKENEKRSEKDDSYKLYDDGSDDDFDFDFDFSFDEAATFIAAFESIVESIYWDDANISDIICEKITKTNDVEDYSVISEFVELNYDILDVDKIIRTMESVNETNISNHSYYLVPELAYNIAKLKKLDMNDIKFKGVYEVYENTKYKYQSIDEMITFCRDFSPLTEGKEKLDIKNDIKNTKDAVKKNTISARNKLSITLNNLRRDMDKLSDKDRALSKNIDMAVERIKANFDRALSSYNREAVIKGSILPSASTCIKAAIITGAAWAVNPAIAVIGLLGVIGLAKSSQKKERQLIIDDIDIELAMCEKYLRAADEKGDMEASRNIMKTQRELQRQKNRLKYNMQMQFHEKTPNLPAVGTSEALNYAKNLDIIEEKVLTDMTIDKVAGDAEEIAKDATNYVKNKAKSEIDTGAVKGKKIINKKLSRQEMLDNPKLLKKYIEEEEDDPILSLNKVVDVVCWLFDASSFIQTHVFDALKKSLKNLAKSTINIADPRVKVAYKRTRKTCEKYIKQITKEIAKEDNPVKKRQLIQQRKQLQECLLEVDNHLTDDDIANIKDDKEG